jgi:hypothetical protein
LKKDTDVVGEGDFDERAYYILCVMFKLFDRAGMK